MDRRAFNKLMSTGVIGIAGRPEAWVGAQSVDAITGDREAVKWPDQVYRRLLVDTHIPDWNPVLLSHFDPADYVATIAKAGFQCLMQYALSCAGLCLWRTKIGQMHGNMKGRDYFGEVMEECKRHGLYRVAYFHVIWDNWGYEKHPDWRYRPARGDDEVLQGRYGYTCINSPCRDYYLALARELVSNYKFEGIFNDMIMWPGVCYCSHCTARFWKEHNFEPPRVVDWDEPAWRAFQKAREWWMQEFAEEFTKTVKSVRPITVEHQFATVFSNWLNAIPLEMANASDFVGGDFYGGPGQFSLACKAFNGLTRHRPFEFMTSRTSDMTDFVTTKAMDELRIESLIPTIHSAALLTIDAINPDGTINHKVYEILGKINAERAPYEQFLGGTLVADVAIYYDKASMYDPEEKGVPVNKLKEPQKSPHLDAVVGVARILREAHIPFGVVTNATLDQLKNYRVVIVPNVLEMTPAQATEFRRFVEEGGVLYASGPSSVDRFNKSGPHFLLEDVLGVRYKGKLGKLVTYLTPKDKDLEKTIWPQNEVIYKGPMIWGGVLPTAEVLATVTMPFADPETIHVIGSRFAQIISDPPALIPGEDPGLVINSFGRGKAVWVAAPIESYPDGVNSKLFLSVLRRVLPGPLQFEVETHPSVEMTLYHQPENKRFLAGLLNMQQQLPPIAVGATVRVLVPPGFQATGVFRLPEHEPIPTEKDTQYIQFRLEPFKVIAMALVEYR